MMGTPNYMAPEQITGESLTPAVDLFSTGAVLYELLTRVKPFQGDTMHNVLFQIVSDNPPDPKSLRPDLPSALNEIVKKALAKNPMDRFHSAAEMANALTAVRAPLGTSRVSNTVSQRVSIERALRERRDASDRAFALAIRWRAVGFTSLALLAAVVGFMFARPKLQRSAGDPPAAPTPAAPSGVAPGSTRDSVTRVAAADSASATRPAPADSARARRQTSPTPPPATPTTRTASASAATKIGQRSDRDASPAGRTAAPPAAPAPQPVDRRAEVARAAQDSTSARRAADSDRAVQSPPPPVLPPAQNPTSSSVVTSSAPPVSAPATKAPEPESPATAIGNIISAYAKAIGTRQVAEIRRIYPGMTQQQQSAWESFFGSVRSMTANLEVSALDVNGNNAVAHLTGQYQYVNRNGRAEHQPASFEAVLVRDGDRWKLQTIR